MAWHVQNELEQITDAPANSIIELSHEGAVLLKRHKALPEGEGRGGEHDRRGP